MYALYWHQDNDHARARCCFVYAGHDVAIQQISDIKMHRSTNQLPCRYTSRTGRSLHSQRPALYKDITIDKITTITARKSAFNRTTTIAGFGKRYIEYQKIEDVNFNPSCNKITLYPDRQNKNNVLSVAKTGRASSSSTAQHAHARARARCDQIVFVRHA